MGNEETRGKGMNLGTGSYGIGIVNKTTNIIDQILWFKTPKHRWRHYSVFTGKYRNQRFFDNYNWVFVKRVEDLINLLGMGEEV